MFVKNTFKHKQVTQDYFPNSRTHSYPEAWGLSQLQIHHEYGKIQCCGRLSAKRNETKTNQKGEKENKKSIHRIQQHSLILASLTSDGENRGA